MEERDTGSGLEAPSGVPLSPRLIPPHGSITLEPTVSREGPEAINDQEYCIRTADALYPRRSQLVWLIPPKKAVLYLRGENFGPSVLLTWAEACAQPMRRRSPDRRDLPNVPFWKVGEPVGAKPATSVGTGPASTSRSPGCQVCHFSR